MNIWNKALVGCIIATSLGLFYTAMRTLKTHQNWRAQARTLEKSIKDLDARNVETQAKLADTQLSLKKLVNDRGRVWRNCGPDQADAQSGKVPVTIDQAEPHGIDNKLVLYVFEEADVDKGGQYVGEFTVDAVADKQVTLKPSRDLTPREFQRLGQSTQGKKPWVLYEKMPFDNHDALADLSEAEKKAVLPAETLNQYVKDGQQATWEQIDEWKVQGTLVDDKGKPMVDEDGKKKAGKGTYVRQLRDYKTLFDWYGGDRTRLADLLASTERDTKLMEDAVADAQRDVEFQKKEIGVLKEELTAHQAELAAIRAHFQAVRQKVAKIAADLNQLMQSNRTKAAELARLQSQATRLIDERAGAMAQSGERVR
jgi:uncharacterized membrane-anchored protein YhcB (DUF1043 family)